MRKQKGQAAVEFAFVVPLFFMMCFGMIYGGMAFMDYLQFNNTARVVARTISLSEEDKRVEIATDFKNNPEKYFNTLTKLYTATPKVTFSDEAEETEDISEESPKFVKIEIELTLNEKDFPPLLLQVKFPPKKLTVAEIVMPLENRTD